MFYFFSFTSSASRYCFAETGEQCKPVDDSKYLRKLDDFNECDSDLDLLILYDSFMKRNGLLNLEKCINSNVKIRGLSDQIIVNVKFKTVEELYTENICLDSFIDGNTIFNFAKKLTMFNTKFVPFESVSIIADILTIDAETSQFAKNIIVNDLLILDVGYNSYRSTCDVYVKSGKVAIKHQPFGISFVFKDNVNKIDNGYIVYNFQDKVTELTYIESDDNTERKMTIDTNYDVLFRAHLKNNTLIIKGNYNSKYLLDLYEDSSVIASGVFMGTLNVHNDSQITVNEGELGNINFFKDSGLLIKTSHSIKKLNLNSLKLIAAGKIITENKVKLYVSCVYFKDTDYGNDFVDGENTRIYINDNLNITNSTVNFNSLHFSENSSIFIYVDNSLERCLRIGMSNNTLHLVKNITVYLLNEVSFANNMKKRYYPSTQLVSFEAFSSAPIFIMGYNRFLHESNYTSVVSLSNNNTDDSSTINLEYLLCSHFAEKADKVGYNVPLNGDFSDKDTILIEVDEGRNNTLLVFHKKYDIPLIIKSNGGNYINLHGNSSFSYIQSEGVDINIIERELVTKKLILNGCKTSYNYTSKIENIV